MRRRLRANLPATLVTVLLPMLAACTGASESVGTTLTSSPLPTSVTTESVALTTSPKESVQQYVGDIQVSETPEHGPMVALAPEGPLHAGADVPLANWDWTLVPDAVTTGREYGFIFGGPWHVVGTWDGTTFAVMQRPVPVPLPAHVERPLTVGCDEQPLVPVLEEINQLSEHGVGTFTANVWNVDGECAIYITAFVDSPALRTLLAPFAEQIVRYEFVLTPLP